jgi:hypothetical protein
VRCLCSGSITIPSNQCNSRSQRRLTIVLDFSQGSDLSSDFFCGRLGSIGNSRLSETSSNVSPCSRCGYFITLVQQSSSQISGIRSFSCSSCSSVSGNASVELGNQVSGQCLLCFEESNLIGVPACISFSQRYNASCSTYFGESQNSVVSEYRISCIINSNGQDTSSVGCGIDFGTTVCSDNPCGRSSVFSNLCSSSSFNCGFFGSLCSFGCGYSLGQACNFCDFSISVGDFFFSSSQGFSVSSFLGRQQCSFNCSRSVGVITVNQQVSGSSNSSVVVTFNRYASSRCIRVVVAVSSSQEVSQCSVSRIQIFQTFSQRPSAA